MNTFPSQSADEFVQLSNKLYGPGILMRTGSSLAAQVTRLRQQA